MLPLIGVTSGLIDFVLNLGVLLLLMVAYGYLPTLNVVFLPVFLLLGGLMALGAGLWLSALNVIFRDISYLLGYLSRFWLYFTPVVYARDVLPSWADGLMQVNPMTPAVEGARWALLGTEAPTASALLLGYTIAFFVLLSGMLVFKRLEPLFADVL